MTRITVAILVMALSPVGNIRGQDAGKPAVSREAVEEVIANAKKGDKVDVAEVKPGRINMSGTGFVVRVQGPLNRVDSYSRERLKQYLPIHFDSIPAAMIDSTVLIEATPLKEVSAINNCAQVVTPPATHIVAAITVDGTIQIVQPLSKKTFTVSVKSNSDLAKQCKNMLVVPSFTATGISAVFPPSVMSGQTLEIRVITESKEFAYKVDPKQRVLVR